MTREETLELISIITAAYPTAEWSDEQIEIWVRSLEYMDFETAQENLYEHILSNRFAPSIAEVVRYDALREMYKNAVIDQQRDEALADHLARGDTPETFDFHSWEDKKKQMCTRAQYKKLATSLLSLK